MSSSGVPVLHHFPVSTGGLSIETVSDTVNRLCSTGVSSPMTLPFTWFMHDGLKSRRVLSPHWLSISISRVAQVRGSLLLVLWPADFNPAMRMGGTIVTSVIVLDVPGNLSWPCPIFMTSSIRFRLAE